MTLEEAKLIAKCVQGVDGGCSYCEGDVMERLMASFPDFVWIWRNRDLDARPRRDGDPKFTWGNGPGSWIDADGTVWSE